MDSWLYVTCTLYAKFLLNFGSTSYKNLFEKRCKKSNLNGKKNCDKFHCWKYIWQLDSSWAFPVIFWKIWLEIDLELSWSLRKHGILIYLNFFIWLEQYSTHWRGKIWYMYFEIEDLIVTGLNCLWKLKVKLMTLWTNFDITCIMINGIHWITEMENCF